MPNLDFKYITDENGNRVLPITHVNAVRDSNGNTLPTLMAPEKNGSGIGTCSTSSGTALTVSLTDYELVQNGFVAVTFENDVPAGATLNINSKGAKPIIYKGSAIEADTIKADDTVMFAYDGTNYVVTSLGGGSINLSETIEINLEQIGGYNEDLIGATITITDLDTSVVLLSTTWQGNTLEYEIEAVTNYKIVVGSVSGYITPSEQQYISKPGRILNINFKYTGVGAYVEAVDGTLYRSSDWASAGKTANSIVVISDAHSYRVSVKGQKNGIKNNSNDTTNPGMPAISDTRNYFNGKADTQKVLAWNTSCGATDINTYAAPYCNSYIFPDGITRGFLMSSGELWFLYNNKQQIEACLTACGGDAFDTTRYTVTSTFTGMWSGSFPCFDEMNWGNGGWYSTNHADTWSNCSTRPIGEYTLQK